MSQERLQSLRLKQIQLTTFLFLLTVSLYAVFTLVGLPASVLLFFTSAGVLMLQFLSAMAAIRLFPLSFLVELEQHEREAWPRRWQRDTLALKLGYPLSAVLLLSNGVQQFTSETETSSQFIGFLVLAAPLTYVLLHLRMKRYDEGSGAELSFKTMLPYAAGATISSAILAGLVYAG
ncbi:hypothetical protein [Alkalicoccus luteus]|uniref:Uncharacterized protein n=1 Tax=Alkalicoccus luteus TaxID=1237094 RepID=A0A969PRV4_9BACI|nr:hypothetical protein [Alkalicoccus luteus]NJP36828.1 hypothetical protein [Alkalicoccus luteus]